MFMSLGCSPRRAAAPRVSAAALDAIERERPERRGETASRTRSTNPPARCRADAMRTRNDAAP